MNNLFKSLLHTPGTENMGGFQNILQYYPDHLVKSMPTLIKKPATLEELALAEGAFEMLDPADKPITIYATPQTVQMKADNQGETDGQSFKVTGEFFYPGIATEASAMSRLMNNTTGYLVLTSPEGEQFLVGQPGLPATIKPAFDGGGKPSDRRGTKFTFECDSFVPYLKIKAPVVPNP